MLQKQNLRVTLITAQALLALGGLGLHLYIHPLSGELQNWIPFAAGLFSLAVITPLFFWRQTVAYAYVLNGMLAVIGTITMTKYKLAPDIALLWAKFLCGKAIFELELFQNSEQPHRRGRFWRYPNLGYWWVHLAAMGAAYLAGYYFWL